MAERYLIDTNTIIDFCNGKLPQKGKELLMTISPEISIVTNIELFATKNIPTDEYQLLQKFVEISKLYVLDATLIETTINIRQVYKIKLPDAIIAATALMNDLFLVFRNLKDFNSIKGLKFINPHEI